MKITTIIKNVFWFILIISYCFQLVIGIKLTAWYILRFRIDYAKYIEDTIDNEFVSKAMVVSIYSDCILFIYLLFVLIANIYSGKKYLTSKIMYLGFISLAVNFLLGISLIFYYFSRYD